MYLELDMECFVQEMVLEAELRMKKADIVGNLEVGRLGLETADKEVLKKLLLKKVQVIEEDPIMVKAVGIKKQENWMKWTAARQRKITWNDIKSIEPKLLQFLLRSVCDVLQSLTNLAV